MKDEVQSFMIRTSQYCFYKHTRYKKNIQQHENTNYCNQTLLIKTTHETPFHKDDYENLKNIKHSTHYRTGFDEP